MSLNSLTQYATSLAESFQALFNYRTEFQNRTFSSSDEAAREISLNWDPRFLPNFEMNDGEPASRQQNFFTLFSFAEVLSEFLVGIEQLGACNLLQTNDFDQFANFAAYTSCFHLIDSFLCLAGIYFIRDPVGDCEWVQDKVMTIPEARGTPVYRLDPASLKIIQRKWRYLVFHKINQQKPRYLIGKFGEHDSGTRWSFRPEGGSIHVSRWRFFGEKLKDLIRIDGVRRIPLPVQQFFGLFRGPLAYVGIIREESEEVPLNRLIDYACIRTRFDGITTTAFAPLARSLAIYRNQSLDEYLRRLGPMLNPRITGAPSKIYGTHFQSLANGMANWQVDRLTSVLSHLRDLPRDVFVNGMRSALLFSGLVELDFSKVENNPLYNSIPVALKDVVDPLFRGRRYIPGRTRGPSWQIGTGVTDIHLLRLPRTIPDILTPRPDWLPRLSYFLSEEP